MPYIVVAIVAAAAGLFAIVSRRPATFRMQRSATIAAPAERIFPLLDNFREWRAWSPWENLDPDMRRMFSGTDRGVGAIYEWSGNRKAGAGSMEISESQPNDSLAIALHFLKPFKANYTTEFALRTTGDATDLTWSMSGKNNFAAKLFGLFVSMDRMVGKDFENGLASLKSVAER
jgi:hypothetical protein